MNNIYFFDLTIGQDFDQLPTDYSCTFSNIEATLPTNTLLTDFFKGGSDVFVTSVDTPTIGADKSVFDGWSYSSVSGLLTDF